MEGPRNLVVSQSINVIVSAGLLYMLNFKEVDSNAIERMDMMTSKG